MQLLRLAGAFPAFAPDGKRLALTGDGFGSLDVMNVDGSERKTIYRGESRGLFSISWAPHGDRLSEFWEPTWGPHSRPSAWIAEKCVDLVRVIAEFDSCHENQ